MRGVWTALVTPFTDDNKLDLDAFRRILQDQIVAKVAGVVPCGTTGESPTLTIDEKKILIHAALQELKGSELKIVAGTGSNNTAETVEFSRWASEQGVDGILVVTPYYNKPSQKGLENHFRAVADSVECEVMLYNVPGRTGVNLASATVASLADHPRIRSLKEATGDVAFASEIIHVLSSGQKKMDLLSGDDATYLPLLSVGATGVVSVASNLFPRAMVAIQDAYEQGRWKEASDIHQRYFVLFRELFVESNPVPIKFAMNFAGRCKANVRLPLSPLSDLNRNRLLESLRLCGIEKGRSL